MVFLDKLKKRGYVEDRDYSVEELANLLAIVDRDYADSLVPGVSLDWKFGIAYNAALKLATIVVRASSLRVKSGAHHKNTIGLIPEILGDSFSSDSEYLDACRRKRNTIEYTQKGGVTSAEVSELQEFVVEFRQVVVTWCAKRNIKF